MTDGPSRVPAAGDPSRVSAAPPAVSVVLPTHNELENLKLLVPELAAVLAGESFELLVVDDASDDGSRAWLARWHERDPRVRALLGDSLRGIGDALRRGYDAARAEIIVSMDADLSFDAEVARRLIGAVRGGLDLVIGSRHHPRGGYEAPTAEIARKRWVSAGANRVLRALVPVGVSDFSVDCRAIRRELWQSLVLRERTNIWLIEMIVEAAIQGARIGEIPVTFRDRRFGASKLRLSREIFVTGWRVLWMIGRFVAARLGLTPPRRRRPEPAPAEPGRPAGGGGPSAPPALPRPPASRNARGGSASQLRARGVAQLPSCTQRPTKISSPSAAPCSSVNWRHGVRPSRSSRERFVKRIADRQVGDHGGAGNAHCRSRCSTLDTGRRKLYAPSARARATTSSAAPSTPSRSALSTRSKCVGSFTSWA